MCHKQIAASARQMGTPLGILALEASESALLRAWFPPEKPVPPQSDNPVLRAAERWFSAYFAGERPDVADLPLELSGSPYQQCIWRQMLRIPYGETCSYGDLCRALASFGLPPGSPRAAGGAVARNPLAIVIPCHRVLGASGKLVGFAAGLWRKQWLLAHEGCRQLPPTTKALG